MRYVVKRTIDLSKKEKKQICNLFFEVFDKKKNVEQFNNQFSNTFCAYSYHGLIIDDNNIVGCYSSIPFMYNYFKRNLKLALYKIDQWKSK